MEGGLSGAGEVVGEVGGAGEFSGDEACDVRFEGEGCVIDFFWGWLGVALSCHSDGGAISRRVCVALLERLDV